MAAGWVLHSIPPPLPRYRTTTSGARSPARPLAARRRSAVIYPRLLAPRRRRTIYRVPVLRYGDLQTTGHALRRMNARTCTG